MICILLPELIGKLNIQIYFLSSNFSGSILVLGFMSFLLVSPTSSVVKSMAGSLEDMPLADADQPQVMERPKGVARKEWQIG